MAEYINKKYLDRKFQIDMMALRVGTIFDTKKIIDSLPTADVIEIPKNATNGDVIKAMFPNVIIQILDNTVYTNIDNGVWFSLDWWNAPYKRGGENEICN